MGEGMNWDELTWGNELSKVGIFSCKIIFLEHIHILQRYGSFCNACQPVMGEIMNREQLVLKIKVYNFPKVWGGAEIEKVQI